MASVYIASLRHYRRSSGRTRTQLAAASGVSEDTIRRIETAEASAGRTRVLARTRAALARALEVTEPALAETPPAACVASGPGSSPMDSYTGLSLDLAGTAEAAEILGVSRERVNQLRKRRAEFPAPVAVLRQGPVWATEDILAFATLKRRTGHPRA